MVVCVGIGVCVWYVCEGGSVVSWENRSVGKWSVYGMRGSGVWNGRIGVRGEVWNVGEVNEGDSGNAGVFYKLGVIQHVRGVVVTMNPNCTCE